MLENANDAKYVNAMYRDRVLQKKVRELYSDFGTYRYSYNFTWLGRPIIQLPQDILALQEIVWEVRPDVIIETGIAHGGSLILYASLLELLGGDGKVLGIDIDIRDHNRKAIETHPLFKRITLVEGSSIGRDVVEKARSMIQPKDCVLVVLDSNHTHEHVFEELQCYEPMVTKGSYLVVLDTNIEDMPENSFSDRPWDKGNNPRTAVWDFLKINDRFVVDKEFEKKLLITSASDGFLKCVKD
jgi:cephalosporin hydroxylase